MPTNRQQMPNVLRLTPAPSRQPMTWRQLAESFDPRNAVHVATAALRMGCKPHTARQQLTACRRAMAAPRKPISPLGALTLAAQACGQTVVMTPTSGGKFESGVANPDYIEALPQTPEITHRHAVSEPLRRRRDRKGELMPADLVFLEARQDPAIAAALGARRRCAPTSSSV